MGNIVLLDDLTINKIAAGEVIERPASVVKELVENAIDAGATSVQIEIKNGGISYIRITDNGKGIRPDDMEIAFERHATSKIRQASDLEMVKSMGFRGEALASIAAIAKVELVSKTADNDIGYKLEIEGGNILNKEETAAPNGTTFTVKDLFYNTPVRYKFLKKDFTESGYIEDVVTRIALVNPDIAIRFISSGKTIIQTNGNGDIKGVIYNIYGKDVAENSIPVSYQFEDLKITGVVGKPVIARSNRSNQLFFVNKRYIKDKILTGAAEQAYKGLITVGKYGFLILNIEMDPKQVDVNVHPAKLEVRFSEESKVFKAMFHAIKDSLLKEDLVVGNRVETNEKINEGEEVKKQMNNYVGLFQKIKNEPKKEEESKNLIEDVFQAREDVQTENKATSTVELGRNDTMNAMLAKIAEMQNQIKEEKAKLNGENSSSLSEGQVTTVEQAIAKNTIDESMEKINALLNKETELPSFINSNTAVANPFVSQPEAEKKLEEADASIEAEKDEKEDNYKYISEELKENATEKTQEEQEIKEVQQPVEEKRNISELLKELENSNKNREEEMLDFAEMYARTFGKSAAAPKVQEEKLPYASMDAKVTTGENISVFENIEELETPTYKFIGIAFSTYIIIEMKGEMYIIDQHAAHERILYEQVKENYYRDENKDSQLMLLPDIITLTHKEMGIARDNMEMFRKAGFMVEEFGENTIKLSGVPTMWLDLETKDVFLETLDEINTVARTAKQEIEEKFIATVACKAAVKANMALTKEEVDSLMKELLLLPNPFTCPHGRPTAIRMTKYDIEKKFERK